MDFVLYKRSSVGEPVLAVEAVLEVKFNYSTQIGDIQRRSQGAIRQARGYATRVDARYSYVLYLVARLDVPNRLPAEPRDAGWKYAADSRDSLQAAGDALLHAVEESGGTQLLFHASPENSPLSCTLFQVGI